MARTAWLVWLAGACAAGPPLREGDPRTATETLVTFEVRLPVDPDQPLAAALPELHLLAGRACPESYEIVDRRLVRMLRSTPVVDRARRKVYAMPYMAGEIVATIRCTRRVDTPSPPPRPFDTAREAAGNPGQGA